MRTLAFFVLSVILASAIVFSSWACNPVAPETPSPQHQLSSSAIVDPSNAELVWSADEQYIFFIGMAGLQKITPGGGNISTIDAWRISYHKLSLSGRL